MLNLNEIFSIRSLKLYKDRVVFGTFWIVLHVVLFVGAYEQERSRHDNLANMKLFGNGLLVAHASSVCLNFNMAVVVLPVCRTLKSWLRSFSWLDHWIPFDKNVKMHIVSAYTILFFTIIHVSAHSFNFLAVQQSTSSTSFSAPAASDNSSIALQLIWSSWSGLTGIGMVTVLVVMASSATVAIRKSSFEFFWWLHHLFVVFFILALLHTHGCLLKTDAGNCYQQTTFMWVSASLVVYLLEVCFREYRSHQPTHITKIIAHPSNVFEIQFRKRGMLCFPGQHVFLCVPEVAAFEWHPYTLTSCPEEQFFSVTIRVVGDWTEALAKRLKGCAVAMESSNLVDEFDKKDQRSFGASTGRPHSPHNSTSFSQKSNPDASSLQLPRLRIDGPFGAATMNIFKEKVAFCVAGGIGATPFASVLKHIWYSYHKDATFRGHKLCKVYFIWVVRDFRSFEWFRDVLRHMEKIPVLTIRIYVTQSLNAAQIPNLMLNDDPATLTARDTVTRLRTRTHYGRPNLASLLDETREAFPSDESGTVGIFYCGPSSLAHDLHGAALDASDSRIRFHFNKEIF